MVELAKGVILSRGTVLFVAIALVISVPLGVLYISDRCIRASVQGIHMLRQIQEAVEGRIMPMRIMGKGRGGESGSL